VELCSELFYAIIPTLFPAFCFCTNKKWVEQIST